MFRNHCVPITKLSGFVPKQKTLGYISVGTGDQSANFVLVPNLDDRKVYLLIRSGVNSGFCCGGKFEMAGLVIDWFSACLFSALESWKWLRCFKLFSMLFNLQPS